MWNHAPEMWAAMEKQGVARPALTPEQAADLFAFFVSAHYFDRPGDAGRGKQTFAARHCAECHGITDSKFPGAPPVAKWESLADPTALAQQMWNHGARMRQAFEQNKIAWVQLSSQDLTDILVYLQNLPETKSISRDFRFTTPDAGAKLFASKGCAGCHTGGNALETKLHNQSLTDIAVDMWNHEPSMKQPPVLTQDEMRAILGYVWAQEFFQGAGNPERGKKVFAEKRCAECHTKGAGGAPTLAKGKGAYTDITMVAALWQHGPHMLKAMEQKRIAWPRFNTGQQMADLIAYLNSL